jgi:pSer/pThr/pTyr-binding forkhead associated (FHA) protein
MAQLIGMSAEIKGKAFNLTRDETVIGRRKESNIMIDAVSVSGRHCLVRKDGNKFFVRDLGSTNGTRLNGRDVNVDLRLRPKDLLQVGTVELIFDSDEPAEETGEDGLANTTRIEIATGTGGKPASFESISPFGSRQKNTAAIWWVIIGVVGVLAVLGAIAFVYLVLGMK